MYEIKNKEFIKAYDELSCCHERLSVFSDFVKMCAISIYNTFANNYVLEKEYLRTINSYTQKEQTLFTKMFGELIMMYEESPEIVDILGPIYMGINSGNRSLGQVFTPEHIAEVMAEISISDETSFKEEIEKNGFITAIDPACGSGGLVLAYAKVLKKHHINYQNSLLVDVTDISSLCVYMTYIQLSLYGIPAIVKCGDSLTQSIHFKMETPLYFLQYWKFRNAFSKKETVDENTAQNENTVDEIILNNFREVMVKGNCQISLF